MIRLTKREKLLAGGLAIFASAWSLFAVGVKPALERIDTLDRVISEKRQELEEIRDLSKEYNRLNKGLVNLHSKDDTGQDEFELLPFLDSLIVECGLSKNVESMKRQVAQIDSNYSEIIVEVRIKSVPIGRLVDFLGKIELSKTQTRTKSLFIKRNTVNKNLLDSVIEIFNTKSSRNEFARM